MSTPYELRNASVFCTQDTKVCLTLTHLMLSKQQAFHALPLKARGPFIKDVRTKGGRGVSPKADIVREVARIYYTADMAKMRTRGGRGSKIPNILRTSFMNSPLG